LSDRSGYEIVLIDASTGKPLDSMLARSPSMSPDQRWLAFRLFYPVHSDIEQSETYWLYDLTKDEAGNKIPGTDYGDMGILGYAIYPIRRQIPSNSRTQPSPETVHIFEGEGFHWAPDSKSLIFTDRTEKGAVAVLALIGPVGVTTRIYHPRSSACGDVIDQAYFVAGPGAPGAEVQVTFGGACPPLLLHSQDFKPADVEFYHPVQKRPSFEVKK
jgi:hypothetical protein